MSRIVELLCSRRMPQVAVLALMSIGFAGCSGDMQTRLSQDSLSNPFPSEATGAANRRDIPARNRNRNINTSHRPCRRRSLYRSLIRRPVPAFPEEGAGWLPMRRPPTRHWKPPAPSPRAR